MPFSIILTPIVALLLGQVSFSRLGVIVRVREGVCVGAAAA